MAAIVFTKGATPQLLRVLNPESWDYHIPGLNGFMMLNHKEGARVTHDIDDFVWKIVDGQPSGAVRGTVDRINYSTKDGHSFLMDSLDLNVKSLFKLMREGDSTKIEDYVLRGNDTVTLSKYWDDFNGGRGNDTIRGMAGNDRIGGGDGADVLWGNAGRDTFVFRTGDDKDRIMDFQDGDRVDLTDLRSITSWSDLKANHLRQYNDHAVIDGGNGDKLVIEHTSIHDLSSDDFIF